MTTDVLGYLYTKGLEVRRAPGNEVHVPCPMCNEPADKRGRMYVNVDPDADIVGLFHCKLCDARGSLVSLQRHFGDATEAQEREDTSYLRRVILATAAIYYHQALADNEDALRWLKAERGLTFETIVNHQLGFADGGLFVHLRAARYAIEDIAATGLIMTDRQSGRTVDFLNGHITIPYWVAGNVVMIRGRVFGDDGQGRKYVTPAGQKTRLFNTDATWSATEICITEGEFDALVLEQLGYAAVACPGANVWQDSFDGYFTQTHRVWVIFDRDERETGAKGAVKVTEHLGAKARHVELPVHDHGKSKNDITEYLVVCGHSPEDFEALLRATRGFLLSVDDAIAEHMSVQGQQGLRFGITKLDLLIEPGLLPAQVMVFLAKTGTGKTIFLLNLFQRICELQPDARILFISLEQTRGDWWERARRIYRFFHPGATDQDAANFWRTRLWMDDRNRLSEEQLLALVDDFRYETGRKPDLLAIDYLGYWAQSFRGERYEKTSDAIMSLKAIGKETRIPVVTPHQVSRMTMHGSEPSIDTARDSGVVEETADFVVPLWMPDTIASRRLDERTGEFKLKIAKSRHGGVGHVESMVFAPLSLAIVAAEELKHSQWARNEMHYQNEYCERWEDALIRHEAETPVLEREFSNVQRAWNRKRQGGLGP